MVQFANETINQKLHLNFLKQFPTSLLDVEAHNLSSHLKAPTLFHIKGHQQQPLFITVLLHGNEITGWQAIQKLLRKYQDAPLPRSILLFVGNIEAAKVNVRTLSNQLDYNRAWPQTETPHAPEAILMQSVYDKVKNFAPFASIDIHNNTGNNPLYGCVNELHDNFLYLASLFSRTIIFFKRPQGVQSLALSKLCPAVTIECGRVGNHSAVEKTVQFLEAVLKLSRFPKHSVRDQDIDLIQTQAIIKVPKEASFSFDGSNADFCFRQDLDHLNFSPLAPGTSLGSLGGDKNHHLMLLPGDDGVDINGYFDYKDDQICLIKPTIPAMLTLDPNAIRSDCLGYLMNRIERT